MTKAQAEKLMQKRKNTNFTIIRPTLLYGPTGGQEYQMYLKALRTIPFIAPVVGCGCAQKRFVRVDDIIAGLSLLVNNPVTYGKLYNFSGGSVESMWTITRLMLKYYNIKRLMHNIRSMEPISFRGRNKLVLIAKIHESTYDSESRTSHYIDGKYNDDAEILYVSNPQAIAMLARDMQTRIGGGLRVRDTEGNTAAYSMLQQATLDTISPVPGSSGAITTSLITWDGGTLNWTTATDNLTAKSSLQYMIYYSQTYILISNSSGLNSILRGF